MLPGTQQSYCTQVPVGSPVCTFCPGGCSGNGTCNQLTGTHDVELRDLRFQSSNGSYQTFAMANILIRNVNYNILIDVFNQGDFTENVSFVGKIVQGNSLLKSFNHSALNDFVAGALDSGRSQTVLFDFVRGYYNVSVNGSIVNDSDLLDNSVKEQVLVVNCVSNASCPVGYSCTNPGNINSTCVPQVIVCYSNDDCDQDGFIGNPFCSVNDVYLNYT